MSRQRQQTWIHRAPPVVTGLIALMVLAHIVMSFGPNPEMIFVRFFGALVPLRYSLALTQEVNPLLLWLPPITHQFLHGGFMHLFLNMMFLLAFGTPLALRFIGDAQLRNARRHTSLNQGASVDEAVMMRKILQQGHLWGSVWFLIFFLSAGLFSGLCFVLLHFNSPVSVIGASGSISALMAAAMRCTLVAKETTPSNRQFPQAEQSYNTVRRHLLPLSDPNLLRFSAAIILLNVAVGAAQILLLKEAPQIAWEAHIAGYLYGLFAIVFFDKFRF